MGYKCRELLYIKEILVKGVIKIQRITTSKTIAKLQTTDTPEECMMSETMDILISI